MGSICQELAQELGGGAPMWIEKKGQIRAAEMLFQSNLGGRLVTLERARRDVGAQSH